MIYDLPKVNGALGTFSAGDCDRDLRMRGSVDYMSASGHGTMVFIELLLHAGSATAIRPDHARAA
jgi:hypothetical protein